MPGYRYLGPGNSVAPTAEQGLRELDVIAREHDLAYERAQHSLDIARADWRAIWRFAETGCLSVLAALLLATKLLLEGLSTCFYPARFFCAMDLLVGILLVFYGCWMCLLDYRLENQYRMRSRSALLPCARASTWETLQCLLAEARVNK